MTPAPLKLKIVKMCAARQSTVGAIANALSVTKNNALCQIRELMHRGYLERYRDKRNVNEGSYFAFRGLSSYSYKTTPSGARWALEQIELEKAHNIST